MLCLAIFTDLICHPNRRYQQQRTARALSEFMLINKTVLEKYVYQNINRN